MLSITKESGDSLPFIKWLGGKRWLANEISGRICGSRFNRYFEPFLGGGAVFFSLRIKPAILSDINKELVNAYIQVRDNPTLILDRLMTMTVDSRNYYEVRNLEPRDKIQKAVRFLYLNRTAFGGIYRLNGKGKFNVPYGNYERGTEILWKDELLIRASAALQGADIRCSDFEKPLDRAKEGDLVYCDPTYTTMHNNNGFRRYNEKSFSWADQERLAEACHKAASRGATIIVSNAWHEEIECLYGGFESFTVERMSVLCPYPSRRKTVREHLFISEKRR